MNLRIASIVEGHGEQCAFPVLLRRIVSVLAPTDLQVIIDQRPWRLPRGTILKNDAAIKQALDTLAISVKGSGGIIVLFDSDNDCPAILGPLHAKRISAMRKDITISVVLANKEYESWFLASAKSCAGTFGLPINIEDHGDPETVRNCKQWLSERMLKHGPYKETLHQELFSAKIDIRKVRSRSASFDKLCREIQHIIDTFKM